jgi:hypothetical protein
VSESAPVTSKPFGRPSGLCAPWNVDWSCTPESSPTIAPTLQSIVCGLREARRSSALVERRSISRSS